MKCTTLVFLLCVTSSAWAQSAAVPKEVQAVYPEAHALYVDLHQHPELSSHETQTAAKLASGLRGLGYEVTEHVGGTGIVAILKNGPRPTTILPTEPHTLPVYRKSSLPS